jgi:hypothetical protein
MDENRCSAAGEVDLIWSALGVGGHLVRTGYIPGVHEDRDNVRCKGSIVGRQNCMGRNCSCFSLAETKRRL